MASLPIVGEALRRILIVEDDPMLRDFMASAVRQQGYEVEEAANGDVAIERLREAPFDAVVLDLMMPVRSGFEVTAFMRTEGIRTPCIVVTGAGPSVSPLVDRSIVTDVLQKPFGVRKLIETIGHAIDERR